MNSDLIAILSVFIATISVLVSFFIFKRQKFVSKINSNMSILDQTLEMLIDNPKLLELHGISEDNLEECNISATEFVYILRSLYSGQIYYAIEASNAIELSEYRKNFLDNPKVHLS